MKKILFHFTFSLYFELRPIQTGELEENLSDFSTDIFHIIITSW